MLVVAFKSTLRMMKTMAKRRKRKRRNPRIRPEYPEKLPGERSDGAEVWYQPGHKRPNPYGYIPPREKFNFKPA